MAAGGRAAVLTAIVLAAFLGACDDAAPPPPAVSLGPAIGVALYGRNSLATDMWVAVDSPIGHPQTVGFHARDLGVACWIAPTNASVVLLDQDLRGVGRRSSQPSEQSAPAGPCGSTSHRMAQ
jgi:hypothetical protein